jgi:hypothetical protein
MGKGPMMVVEASMVQLPFALKFGQGSLLNDLVEADVPVQTFGSATVSAIIDYKWNKFARRAIFSKLLVYLTFTLLFTIYGILFANDDYTLDAHNQFSKPENFFLLVLDVILWIFGFRYIILEGYQMNKVGIVAYFNSIWNFVDIISYGATLVITPCHIMRYQIGRAQAIPALIAVEVIALWVKLLFFGLAFDGLGTFIIMTIEIIKRMWYFFLLLMTILISWSVAFMVLFRDAHADLGKNYDSFGTALLYTYAILMGQSDYPSVLKSEWSSLATALYCIVNFLLVVILLNMLITFMSDIYMAVQRTDKFVFLKGRAELIIEVESTMGVHEIAKYS